MPLIHCKRCRRLSHYLKRTKTHYPDYYCQPVPAYGDPKATLLIVGLAPGLHGANASGIPFTGDASGEFLFNTLFKFGFSNTADSNKTPLALNNCRITNAVKCLPPQNKPSIREIQNCVKHFLSDEINQLAQGSVILALGKIAHDAVLRGFSMPLSKTPFAHNRLHDLENGYYLLDSYHCSRYNTQTKRLTQEQFDQVFIQAKALLN